MSARARTCLALLAGGVLAGGVLVVAPPSAHANSVDTVDCWTLDFVSVFNESETVCVMGDFDTRCAGAGFLPSGDIYVIPTGAAPLSCARPDVCPMHITTIGGAGSFIGEPLWYPPLTPGTYDIVIDENCNGTFDSGDLRRDRAFRVRGVVPPPLTCMDPPFGYAEVDPDIASGSHCRGACGPGCPETCIDPMMDPMWDESVQLCVDNGTSRVDCDYAVELVCGSHQGCVRHDACYDQCSVTNPCNGDRFLPCGGRNCCLTNGGYQSCMLGCDAGCFGNWGPFNCNAWRQGEGRFTAWIEYVGEPTASAPTAGVCGP